MTDEEAEEALFTGAILRRLFRVHDDDAFAHGPERAPNNVPAIYRAQNFSLNVGTNEEDLAAPHGSFVSTMVAPEIHQGVVKLADGAEPDDYQVNLSTIVAASLE